MELSFRRHILPAAALIIVTLLSSGRFSSRSIVPSLAQTATAATSDDYVAFDPPDVAGRPSKAPPVLLAGKVSNERAIWPVSPIPRPNGYCVTLKEGVTGVAPYTATGYLLGFTVAPGSGLAANVVPGDRSLPSIRVDGVPQPPLNQRHGPMLIPGSAPDQYCVQINAPVGYTSVVISWTYTKDSVLQAPVSLEIPVANVTLAYTNGRFSPGVTPEPARVCTEGWGWDPGSIPIIGGQQPFFLTGEGAMSAARPEANVVVAANPPDPSDWHWTNPTLVAMPSGSIDYYELHSSPIVLASPPETSKRVDHYEHCISLSANVAISSDVTLRFGSIYQPGVVAESLPPVISETPPATVTFTQDSTKRLRDIGPSGQMLVPELVKVGFPAGDPVFGLDILRKVLVQENIVRTATHTVCVTQTNAAMGGFRASSPDGANVVGLTQFVATAAITPDLAGAACFSWTSSVAGTQFVSVDGVGEADGFDGLRFERWVNLHYTKLTDSQYEGKNDITNTTLSKAMSFNLGNGTFSTGPLNIVEWVYGNTTPRDPGHEPHTADRLVDGAIIRVSITSACGGFNNNPNAKVILGHSVWGRFEIDNPPDSNPNIDDLRLTITNDTACGIGATVTLTVDVFYPEDTGLTTPSTDPETLTVNFTFTIPSKTPRFAWAGQQVTLSYLISVSDAATCVGSTVRFVRASGQPGAFLPGPGVALQGPSEAVVDFAVTASSSSSNTCNASVKYESEDPGEVDVEAFIQGAKGTALETAGPFSKLAMPIYFMIFEDTVVTGTPTTVVSEPGDVTANVRGYFLGTNPSGRASETKADGRSVPADRWVMPDDYDRLRGDSAARSSWPSSVPMPAARVTFLMQNEGVVNSFQAGVKNGALGWFIPDDVNDLLANINVNPVTNQPSILGSVERPRIMNELSDTSGIASVDTFGDFNLSFEGCAKSPINGNPYCKPDDVVGHTTYYTIADYPFAQKKFPPVISNTVTTEFTWFGYKQLTVVNSDDPQVKYVVAHLRDRDGFCDAVHFNNVLGVPVKFEIDAGNGVIIGAADAPFSIAANRRYATATTFDILDDAGRPINEDIAKTPISKDECQAWIKVSNSLLAPTNVLVTFPAPPSPIPADVRITGLTCQGAESITVTNQGNTPTSLAGFSIQSLPAQFGPNEHLGLAGHLDPGQSMTFYGGPKAPDRGWLFSQDLIFSSVGDFASLVWEGYEIDRVYCDGRPAIHNPVPATLASDTEGEIVLDITIPFGAEKTVALDTGWNLVAAGSVDTDIKDALAGNETKVVGIYLWDPVKGSWSRFMVGAPDYVNNITKFEKNRIYWVQVNQPFTLTLLK